MRAPLDSNKLLDETRSVVREARSIVEAGEPPRLAATRTGILAAYEALCGMLDDVDAERVEALIARISEQRERWNQLAGDVERLRILRHNMRES